MRSSTSLVDHLIFQGLIPANKHHLFSGQFTKAQFLAATGAKEEELKRRKYRATAPQET